MIPHNALLVNNAFSCGEKMRFCRFLKSRVQYPQMKNAPVSDAFEWVRSLKIADKRFEESDAFFHRFDVHVLV